MALAGASVVAAVVATAPSMANAVSSSSSGTRHSVAQKQNAESASTAPNLRVKAANGVTYQYRRFGNPSADSVPLVFFQHFRGTLDSWDPKLIDTIAAKREVILVDNVGVGGSTGTTASTVQQMALDAIEFIDALKLPRYDGSVSPSAARSPRRSRCAAPGRSAASSWPPPALRAGWTSAQPTPTSCSEP